MSSSRNVSTEALLAAARALTDYINSLANEMEKMNTAAVDCWENMHHDHYSEKAIIRVAECVGSLEKALIQAEQLRKKILQKMKWLEDNGASFLR